MKAALVSIGLAAAFATTPAAAEELKKLPASLDPAKAYVVVELGSLDATKMPGMLVVARYDPGAGDLSGMGRAARPGGGKPPRPETAEKGLVKDKDRGARLHLLALEPDLYVVQAANGTSFSLGSRSFRAEAGQVIDLGVMKVATDWPEGEGPAKIGVGDILKMGLFGAFAGPKQQPRPVFVAQRAREAGDMALPPLLAARAQPVEWQSRTATFGNHLGGLVNRFGGRAERGTRPATAPAEASPPAQD